MSESPTPAPSAEPTAPTELTYAQAFNLAINLHRRSRFEEAEPIYRALLAAAPDDANVLHFLGVLLHRRGRDEEGLDLIQRSIALDANVASWYNNLGNVFLDLGLLDEAAAAYTRCVELDPDNLEVLNNLGVMLRNQKRFDEAEAILRRAVAKEPAFVDAHHNLAVVFYRQNRIKEGYVHSAAALALKPAHPATRKVLAAVYASLGRLDDAAKIYRDWLDHEPDNEEARHHLAACLGQNTPDRASDGYVEKVFDAFASSFDAKLTALDYRAPQLIGETVARLLGAPQPRLRIIDAGCGTGLCGAYLRPYATGLTGVDLSGNMLARAQTRGQYTDLVKAELVAYLENCDVDHDLIVSADTLCYFGRIEAAIKGARRALRPGGHLMFTVETHEGESDYVLNPHGRYSHREHYIRTVLADAGFTVVSVIREALRTQVGEPVPGLVVAAQVPASA